MKQYPIKTEYYDSFFCDFEGNNFKETSINDSYKYKRNSLFFKLARFFLYRCLATPAAFIYSRVILRDKIHGKEKLKPFKKQGMFIYGNHTRDAADAFVPSVAVFPKRVHVVVSSKNLSIPILGKCLPYLGAIPTPTEFSATKNFSSTITEKAKSGDVIMIYPEAHLWPFMKELRPFGSESFTYPVRANLPTFTLTRTYKKTKRAFRSDIYIDGPFFPDAELPPREAREDLCNKAKGAMASRCALSDIEVIKYERKETEECAAQKMTV